MHVNYFTEECKYVTVSSIIARTTRNKNKQNPGDRSCYGNTNIEDNF